MSTGEVVVAVVAMVVPWTVLVIVTWLDRRDDKDRPH